MTKTPESEAALADLIASASGPLSIRGGNTRGMAGPGEPVSLSALSGITLYEPGALTLVAQAGTPVAEIEATLAMMGNLKTKSNVASLMPDVHFLPFPFGCRAGFP